MLTHEGYDFKGNLLGGTRRLTRAYAEVPDWAGPVDVEDAAYTSTHTYDALDRATTTTTPDGTVVRPAYNDAGLLERLDANLRGEVSDGATVWTTFVEDIDYDAKGRRSAIRYGNGATTTYDHDPLTFRLTRLRTTSGGQVLQDLNYTYDPVGNITHRQDDAQPTIFFRNRMVAPSSDYVYDAVYRLIEATGREHLGQIGNAANPPTPPDADNLVHLGLVHPGDGNAMGTYRESFVHDAVGNLRELRHVGTDPAHPGWTRAYHYAASPDGQEAVGNRLTSTQTGGRNDNAVLLRPARQHDDDAAPDRPPLELSRPVAGKQPAERHHRHARDHVLRLRLRRAAGAQGHRASVGRRRRCVAQGRAHLRGQLGELPENSGDGSAVGLERETLHILDDKQRVALLEDSTSR